MNIEKLIKTAEEMRNLSYVPYSGFSVGAALLCEDGTVFRGCNIENAAYGPSVCAERTAFFKAVSEGKRKFTAIAVTGGRKGEKCTKTTPCGVCRQVMREFCDPKEFRIIVSASADDYDIYTLEELLPAGFGPENLN